MEGYIRTSERFRVIRVFFGVPESYGNSPGEVVGLNGPYGKGEKERGGEEQGKVGCTPCPIRTRGGGGHASFLLASLLYSRMAQQDSILLPVNSRNSPVLRKYLNHLEPFRCPNIVIQYIDLYVSTISRLLVMSPISSGTPNYLRYIKTHKLII